MRRAVFPFLGSAFSWQAMRHATAYTRRVTVVLVAAIIVIIVTAAAAGGATPKNTRSIYPSLSARPFAFQPPSVMHPERSASKESSA